MTKEVGLERHSMTVGHGWHEDMYYADGVDALVASLQEQIASKDALMLGAADWLEKACFGWPPEYWSKSAEALRKANKLRAAAQSDDA